MYASYYFGGRLERVELGEGTNNLAEYQAVSVGLKAVAKNYPPEKTKVIIYLDSELVRNQVESRWKINQPDLKILANEIRDLVSRFKQVTFQHIPRSETESVLGH